jgi:hypothetical protein
VSCDLQAAAEFVKKQGLVIIVKEALRENVLASTQILISQILHLFARSHFEELVDAKLVSAIGRMLSHKTKRGADERHLDVDVQHAALSLVLRVQGLGRPRQVHLPERSPCCSCLAAYLASSFESV